MCRTRPVSEALVAAGVLRGGAWHTPRRSSTEPNEPLLARSRLSRTSHRAGLGRAAQHRPPDGAIVFRRRGVTIGESYFDAASAHDLGRVDLLRVVAFSSPVEHGSRERQTLVLDLGTDEDRLLEQMSKHTTCNIRRAMRKDPLRVAATVQPSGATVDEFSDLYDRFTSARALSPAFRPRLHAPANGATSCSLPPPTGTRAVLAQHAYVAARARSQMLYSASVLAQSADSSAQASLRWTRQLLEADVRTLLANLPTGATVQGVARHRLRDRSRGVRADAGTGARVPRRPRAGRTRGGDPHPGTHASPHGRQPARWLALATTDGHGDAAAGRACGAESWNVGQSRSRDSRARVMVLDLTAREATLHGLSYDVARCRRVLRERGLPATSCHLPRSRWEDAVGVAKRGVRRVQSRIGKAPARRNPFR